MSDFEGHSITVLNNVGTASFVTFSSTTKSYQIAPTTNAVTGLITIYVTLQDGGTHSTSIYPKSFQI
jgi:hypothetical protein